MAMKSLSGEVNQGSSAVSGTVTSTGRSYSANAVSMDSPVYYSGLETDSLKINVDNTSKTIGGEVKWQNMIAMNPLEEDAYHAYPANKANIMFNQLKSELASLASNVDNLDKSCVSSVQTIMKYVDDLAAIQTEIEACNRSLVALNGAISSERIAREQDDIRIKNSQTAAVDRLNQQMSQLVTLTQDQLNNQDAIIQRNTKSIQDETARAKASEETLDKRVQSIINTLNQVNISLSATDVRTDSLNTRINAIENSNTGATLVDHSEQLVELSTDLSQLKLKSKTDIDSLKTQTSTLTDVVYKNSSKLTEVNNLLKCTDDVLEELKQEHAEQQDSIAEIEKKYEIEKNLRDDQYLALANNLMGEANIRKTTADLHETELVRLEKRISNLQENMYNIVHDLGEEFRLRDQELLDNIENVSYSFIDGGNAPV